MSKLCFFEGQLCQVTKVESGYLLIVVPTIETFEASKTPVKPVKESKKKIDLTSIESKATPMENKKETAIKPTNKATTKAKAKAKIDIVQTQCKTNAVKNGNYRMEINSANIVLTVDGITTTKVIKTDLKQVNKITAIALFQKHFGKIAEIQEIDAMSMAIKGENPKYIITVRNKTPQR